MPNIRRTVAYPRPKDVDAREEIGGLEHIPLAVVNLGDQVTIFVTKTLRSPKETPAFFRIGKTYFPSMQVLEACTASDGGKEVCAHSVHPSSGGTQIFLAPDDTLTVA